MTNSRNAWKSVEYLKSTFPKPSSVILSVKMLRIAVFLLLLTEYSCFLVLPNSNETVVLPPINGTVNLVFSRRPVNSGKIPIYYDWREENMVSPVKNQLNCAACWAFSTIGKTLFFFNIIASFLPIAAYCWKDILFE